MFDYYREQVQGTTIDSTTLLSTDYFNLFNEVIMLLGMLPDMPDMLEEVDNWSFRTYAEHFSSSGLSFAPLAIEAYQHAPQQIRQNFETNIAAMRQTIEESRGTLHALLDAGEQDRFADLALMTSMELQRMVDTGSAIVHGQELVLDQSEIDNLF